MIESIPMDILGYRICGLARLIFLGIAAGLATVATPWAPVCTAQPIVYSSDFNDGRAESWQLESNWEITENRLTARGAGWARYHNGSWENLVLSFVFNASNKGLQANIRLSDKGRYGVGFSPQRGFLTVYLFKETVAKGPNSFRNLAKGRIPTRGSPRGLRVEISARDDRIAVSVNGKPALSARDPEPLPAGIIGFESLKDSQAFVDDVMVRAERPWVSVPALIGKPVAEARTQLSDLRLGIGQTKERPADLKEGQVVDQHPADGSRVAVGAAVNLVVSAGRQQVDVPRLIGMKRGEALRMIREAGLKVGGIRQGDSARDDVVVVDQDPDPGVRVSNGTAVSITVAGSELFEVPRVIDKPLTAAREALERSGLAVGEVARKPSDIAPDTVFDQQPKPGSRAVSGSQVQLWVSSGPGAAAEDVEIPRLVGLRRDEAGQILRRARLQLGKVHEKGSSAEPGTIVEQDPAPNTRVRLGSSVDLWVGASSTGDGQNGGMGWLFPTVAAGVMGILAGYLGAKGLGRRSERLRQPVHQVTVRVLSDSGEQVMETTASGPEPPILHCRVIPDAGKQQMNVSGTARADEEDTHVG
ncbi:MAG: PASTA domain-containing protein [Syntrophobacteraceae bacterium]